MDPLRARLDALDHHLQILQQQTRTATRRLRWWRRLAGLAVLSWALPSGTAQGTLEERVKALEATLAKLTFDAATNEMVIAGANLRIVNGLGRTDCPLIEGKPAPGCPNGLDNLIVGYNEPRAFIEGEEDPNNRTGSHNIVVGSGHNFSRLGGLVTGRDNEISGNFAVVSGGFRNTASGDGSVVSGGQTNTARSLSMVSGGFHNTASGRGSVVSGGEYNMANGLWSSVSGGALNTADGDGSVGERGSNQQGQRQGLGGERRRV